MNMYSNVKPMLLTNISISIQELYEKIRKQEEIYEDEVKKLKQEIKYSKKKLSENEEIYQERLKNIHEDYSQKVQTEKVLTENSTSKQIEKLKSLKEDLRVTKEEGVRVLATSSRIKASLQEEVSSLDTQKHSFLGIISEIQTKTKTLEKNKIKELKKTLKTLKNSQNSETEEKISKFSIEQDQFLRISTQKTDLLHKLQQTLSELKSEQSQNKTNKNSKLSELNTMVKSTKSDIEDYKFRTEQVKSQMMNRRITEQEVQNKALMLENLQEVNKDLWNRYEKLSKLIF